jgi:heat-inducible transcriptional repressor
MADLEELGYITQPYTSAGRIPTEKGYRLYVNSILKNYALKNRKKTLQQLQYKLRIIEKDIHRLIKEASRTLSDFSHYLGVAIPPKVEDITIKKIEFLGYDRRKIHAILISEEGIIRNKIISMNEPVTQQQLKKITRYLNDEFSGLTLKELKTIILNELSEEKNVCDKLILEALMICKKIMAWETEHLFQPGEISGTGNLTEFATMKQIKQLFSAIEDKHLLVKLLEKMTAAVGVQVFIGSENIISEIRELSMVAATYHDGHRMLGTIGIIGPTRMDYERVIPIVDLTAKTLTQILSEK